MAIVTTLGLSRDLIEMIFEIKTYVSVIILLGHSPWDYNCLPRSKTSCRVVKNVVLLTNIVGLPFSYLSVDKLSVNFYLVFS